MEKIAVIGMANLFPGSQNLEEFWQNLLESKDSRSLVTDREMETDVKAFYSPKKGQTDRFYSLEGGYVRGFAMNSTGFHLDPDFVNELDDLFQWSLHVSREALRDSGYLGNQEVLKNCGVILGKLSFPTKASNHLFLPIYHRAVESSLKTLLKDPAIT